MKNYFFYERNCLISKSQNYRWSLSFKISKSNKEIIFIGLNPSLSKNLKYWSENQNCDLWMGWGNNGSFLKRNQKISKKIKNFYSTKKVNFVNPLGPLFIKKTKKQNPIHPLYCSDDSVLQVESL